MDFGGNPGWTALARLKNGRDKLKFELSCSQGCNICSVLRQAVSELHPYFGAVAYHDSPALLCGASTITWAARGSGKKPCRVVELLSNRRGQFLLSLLASAFP